MFLHYYLHKVFAYLFGFKSLNLAENGHCLAKYLEKLISVYKFQISKFAPQCFGPLLCFSVDAYPLYLLLQIHIQLPCFKILVAALVIGLINETI